MFERKFSYFGVTDSFQGIPLVSASGIAMAGPVRPWLLHKLSPDNLFKVYWTTVWANFAADYASQSEYHPVL
jgi:hypothetical protein